MHQGTLISIDEACTIIGVSRTTFRRLISVGDLPKPIKIRTMARWHRQDIDEFLEKVRQSKVAG